MEPLNNLRLIHKVLMTLNLEQYLDTFEAQAITDDILKDDFPGSQDKIRSAIPALGHRIRFIKEFESAAKIELDNATTVHQSAFPETVEKENLATPNDPKSLRVQHDVQECKLETAPADQPTSSNFNPAEVTKKNRPGRLSNFLWPPQAQNHFEKYFLKKTPSDRSATNVDKIEKTTSEMKEVYRRSMEQVTRTEDFQSAHDSAVAIVKDIVTRSGLEIQSQETCWKAFSEVTANFKLWDDEALKISVDILKTHFRPVDSLLASNMPIDKSKLEACRSAALTAMQKKLNTLSSVQNKALGVHFRLYALKQIENAINSKFEQIEAATKCFQLQQESENLFQKLVLDYNAKMEDVVEKSVDKNDFDNSEKLLVEFILDAFKTSMDWKTLDSNFAAENEKKLLTKLKTERQGYWRVFLGRLKEDTLHVDTALLEARKFYDEEMKAKFSEKLWFPPPELEAFHQDLKTRAIKSALAIIKDFEDITLTPVQISKLETAFQHVYFRYKQRNEMQNPVKDPTIGIDLGTTYSCVGVFQGDKVVIIGDFNAGQKQTMPSYVAFNEDGSIAVGDVAERLAHRKPQDTVFDAKRLIGGKFEDRNIQKYRDFWPFKVVNFHGEPRIEVRERQFRPEEISSKILAKLKSIAEEYLGQEVTKAVVTVPAKFGDAQRKATKDAAEIAGLEATILNEPTAAAICYELQFTGEEERNVLIFDLGGGTFDVVILSMFRGEREYKVRAIGGDTHLGGRDFDNNIMEALVNRVKDKTGIDLANGKDSKDYKERMKALSRLRRILSACEEQKRILSVVPKARVIVSDLEGGYNFDEEFTRQEFEEINMNLFDKCIAIVDQTLQDAKISKQNIHDIVLVGGSTKIPKVQEMLSKFFDGKTLNKRINPDEAVAHGAALIYGKDQVSETKKDLMIKDVTSFPLGIAVSIDDEDENAMQVIIPQNSEIPITMIRSGFTTTCDGQTDCDIEIYEGKNYYVKDNTFLGQFKLTGIPPGPAGEELVECSMTIDGEGVLKVKARVVTNGKSEDLQIETYNSRMTNREKRVAKNQDPFRWKK